MTIEVLGPDGKRHLAYEDFELEVRDGLISAETPIRFEVVTGSRFVPAGELELFHALADAELRRFRLGLRSLGMPLMTAALVGLQLRIYLFSKGPGVSEVLIDAFTNWAPAILEHGEVHRLFSYGLLHLSLPHLAFNLLFLAYVGWNLERGLGRKNMAAVFFFSVFGGGLLSLVMSPGRPSLGASGGDFGLLAAAVVFGWKHGELIPDVAQKFFGWAVVWYLGVSLVMGFFSPNVDNWGHIGGLLAGATLGTVLEPEVYSRHQGPNRRHRRTALLATLIAMVALMRWGPGLVQLTPFSAPGLQAATPSYWKETWAFTGDRGWVSPVRGATLVVHTGVFSHPQTPDEAVARLLDQVDTHGTQATIASDETMTLGGWPGRRLRLAFQLRGEPQVMEALVVTRGAYVYRLHLHAPTSRARQYHQLASRVLDAVALQDPADLVQARRKSLEHPRSWPVWMEVGRAAARAGHPTEAAEAFARAYQLTKRRKDTAAVGRLDVYADYGEGLDADTIAALVADHGSSARVLVAAAGAWARAGREDQAVAVLDRAALDHPDDFAVRRARDRRGLPEVLVEIPAPR